MALILGKKTVGRLETLQYANKKFKWRNDVIIGIGHQHAFWAWLLARLTGRKCIYYCIDFYSPEISDNLWDRIFIWAAMLMDMFLVKQVDEVWDISKRIQAGRKRFGGYIAHIPEIVPLSYPPSYFNFVKPIWENPVYVGLVPYGKEIMPKDTFYIDGKMPLQQMLNLIARCKIGISLWDKNGNNYYGDPGKTKLYSACGLPVIMTDNTPYADIIKRTGAGLVISYNKNAVKWAIKKILGNYAYYKKNVKKTWGYINADTIFKDIRLLER